MSHFTHIQNLLQLIDKCRKTDLESLGLGVAPELPQIRLFVKDGVHQDEVEVGVVDLLLEALAEALTIRVLHRFIKLVL